MAYDEARVEFLLRQERTKEVIDELLVLNYGLITKALYRFYLANDPDALSFAYESLYNAIKTFDLDRNHRFSTYASVCIYNRLGSHIRSLNTQLASSITSYEQPVDENGTSLIDLLESPQTADGPIMVRTGVDGIHSKVRECYHTFTNPLHKRIIKLWIDSDFEMTHVKIAEAACCTQSYVSQVIKTYKYKLEGMLNEL